MAILATGNTFVTGDSVTALTLNNAVNLATFAAGAVDNATTKIDGNGAIIVMDGGIDPTKLSDGGPTWSEGTTTATNFTATGTVTAATGQIATLNVTGTSSIYEVIEKATVSAVQPIGTVNFNVLGGAVVYYTGNASGQFTLNVRGSSTTTFTSITSVDDVVTIALVTTQGATAYAHSGTMTIDGNAQPIKWVGGQFPNGTANGIDVYTFTIIKTVASPAAYVVLGSKTSFA